MGAYKLNIFFYEELFWVNLPQSPAWRMSIVIPVSICCVWSVLKKKKTKHDFLSDELHNFVLSFHSRASFLGTFVLVLPVVLTGHFVWGLSHTPNCFLPKILSLLKNSPTFLGWECLRSLPLIFFFFYSTSDF